MASNIINISKQKNAYALFIEAALIHNQQIFLVSSAMYRCFKLDLKIIKDVRNVTTTSENNKNVKVYVTCAYFKESEKTNCEDTKVFSKKFVLMTYNVFLLPHHLAILQTISHTAQVTYQINACLNTL